MKSIYQIFFFTLVLCSSGFAQEEEVQAAPAPEPEKATYVVKLNSTETCGKKTKDKPVECEMALIHAKHSKKLMLFKFNTKNSDSGNQVTINDFMAAPDTYSSYGTDYTLSSLFAGKEAFASINVFITTHEQRRKIKIKAHDGTAEYVAYIDIHNYLD